MIKRVLLQAPTAWQALGYSIIAKYLSGEINYNEMREKIITATWQFARRQETWFKNKHPNLKIIKMPHEAGYINFSLRPQRSQRKARYSNHERFITPTARCETRKNSTLKHFSSSLAVRYSFVSCLTQSR